MVTDFDATLVGLSKWPQMRVTGPSISPEQALEIIIRTDQFWMGYGGNNHEWERELCARVGFPRMDYGLPDGDWQAMHAGQERFRESIGYIATEYVNNHWIASAFVFGPSGWCHPDGRIYFKHNVGKWPSVEDIMGDWALIAQEWTFLDLDVSLMSGEGNEEDTVPVVNLQVKAGKVTAHDPAHHVFGARFGHERLVWDSPFSGFDPLGLLDSRRENHFRMEHVVQLVEGVQKKQASRSDRG